MHLWLCSNIAQDLFFSTVIVLPNLVQNCGMGLTGMKHLLGSDWGLQCDGHMSSSGCTVIISLSCFCGFFWVSINAGHLHISWITLHPPPPRSLDPVPNCGIKQMGPGCLLSSDWGHSEAAVTRADLSLPCLVASQHPHIFHKWSLGLSRLSSCPSSSPSSQGELSPLWRTPGLGHTVCSSTYSLLRTRVYPCMHPFFLSPLPGAQVPTQCHSFHPTQLQGDLSCSLRLCRSSYARLQ